MYVFCTIDPPAITTEIPHTLRVMPGDEHKIDCAATGNPQPNVVWRKSDVVEIPIPDGYVGMYGRFQVYSSLLQVYGDDMGNVYNITNLIADNHLLYVNSQTSPGNYTCRAENTVGSDEKQMAIVIISKVIFAATCMWLFSMYVFWLCNCRSSGNVER